MAFGLMCKVTVSWGGVHKDHDFIHSKTIHKKNLLLIQIPTLLMNCIEYCDAHLVSGILVFGIKFCNTIHF